MSMIYHQTRDVNRVPGPGKTTRTRVSNYPKATRKFLRDSKIYSGEEIVKKNFYRTNSKHKPKHQQGQDGRVLQ